MKRTLAVALVVSFFAVGCTGPTGPAGATGQPGQPGTSKGSLAGVVKDASGAALAGVSVQTDPTSLSATSAADGTFSIANIGIGAYTLTASKSGYATFSLAGVGVVANGTTNVSLVLQGATSAPGSIAGTVTDAASTPVGLPGVEVAVAGTTIKATTAADGTFALNGVPPGPTFLSAKAPSASFLDGETRAAIFVPAGGSITGASIVLSARPSDGAQFVGMGGGCAACHSAKAASITSSAHNRSLTRITRDGSGHATAGAFARVLNGNLTKPRIVMAPLAGTITVAVASAAVVGTGTAFTTQVAVNDTIGYMPVGLGWYALGSVASITDDTHLTLKANAAFAPQVTSLTNATFSTQAASKSFTRMLPVDSTDIVAPGWPGVKATNPNYDANDPCIYAAPASGTCAAGGTAKYADGQVNVYLCNLKDGATYLNDEFVQKFGGSPFTCADGTIHDAGTNPNPAVPMVRIAVIYGGQGDKDGNGVAHQNMGVFKQRFQGLLSDVKAATSWAYTAGKDLDSLTLPIQFLESGDKSNGVFKMNGYHPTEQKFPGESWSQRSRTFSHACAGCHNVGLTIDWDMATVTLPFGRDGAPNNSPFTYAAIKTYGFKDENLTCEHCHGPGSEHVSGGGGRGNKIINPKYLTAESERQLCGKCHAYDDATNAKPLQDYGFEYAWNTDYKSLIGGGDFVPGVFDISTFFDNWMERLTDDEASWDPAANGGKVYGQAHRQQYIMLAQSKHANNPYLKTTCSNCHDPHTLFKATPRLVAGTDQFDLTAADYRNNVSCLSCHAGIPGTPFAGVTKADVATVHVGSGGVATKNGAAFSANQVEVLNAKLTIGNAVGQHMFDKANMMAAYDPMNAAMPTGRCTSCHMPKVAKSGGYTFGPDANGAETIVEGDQGSHVFDIIWPWQANAQSRGGPTFQSSYYGQFVSASGIKYDKFGTMPSSCSKCHVGSRRAAIACPDNTSVWPAYFPLSEHRDDTTFWPLCFTTLTAP